MALFRQWEGQAQAAICSQHSKHRRRSQNIIKIFIYKSLSKITSHIHSQDFGLYAWIQVDTISVRTPEERPIFQWSYCSTRQASFNPHLLSGAAVCHKYWYQLPSTLIHIYPVITIRGVFQWLAFPRRGLILGFEKSTGIWLRIDLRTV